MRVVLPSLCFGVLLAGCAAFEISTDATGLAQKKATKPTGSNYARMTRDPDLEGWRQGMDRDDMREIQRARPLAPDGGGSPIEGKGAWKK